MRTVPRSGEDLFALAPVMPVVVLEEAEDAVPLARALVAGGLPGIEVTLRTPAALSGIERIAAEVPEAVVGAGTIVNTEQVEAATEAGARFLVSPGSTPDLLRAMFDTGLPCLPGVATVSEAMALMEWGTTSMKFFPAEAAGGTAFLKSLAGPLPQARLCPTGGITRRNASDYLALPNVGCVGGSWPVPAALIASGRWEEITGLAREASSLRT
ncbi:bifunctional 4-hydroxy-2-oxoglutarate aldolase/2-dehydro-3-deoxy-phosphogluconate aldolase [Nocardiopsis alba]|jgi:2-dehydro-3-deoxyphosphogluconate aldolase/(4S)-4-hydroxy-2-oxoglutarate aldolase|uniref:bifunctional 4-hydroxy-2-oxoglutarate aldolase/2-dehydro-3-deoxy-phosphogluconate aldolase n=1 Tax=Nocardiopsis alba TaxID=53437 RepID=UPI0033A7261D